MDLASGITQEDLKLFLQEADEQIQLLDEDIVRLEKEAGNSDLIQEIFRAAHTLKGSSAMVGNQRMSELAHAMENVLDGVRKGTLAVCPPVVDALLHGLDLMRVLRQEMVKPGPGTTDIGGATDELAAVMKAEKTDEVPAASAGAGDRLAGNVPEGKKAFRVSIFIDKRSTWASVRCFQIIQELSQIGEIIDSVPGRPDIEAGNAGHNLELLVAVKDSGDDIKKVLEAVADIERFDIKEYKPTGPVAPSVKVPNAEANALKKDEAKLGQTVRVDVGRLDTLMEQVGELVINRNQIGQIGRLLGGKYRDDELVQNLGDCLSQITKIVSTLQHDVMSVRLLPIEIIFNTLPRMVRDTSHKMGKKVDFIIEGQETEVDRSVIEHLRDPLIHLLRNAIDHGIEPPEERLAAGKPEVGTVILSANHEQDSIIIRLKDDGRGIDSEKLRQKCVEKGLLSAEASAELTDAEAINLIFNSGFSTAKEVTDVSGRGVGLDVVKTNVEIMGGSVSVQTDPGKGTTFILTLPLTLAIIPALLVATGDNICAIPLSSIVESNKVEAKDIKTVGGRKVMIFRGNVLPLILLDEAFGWQTEDRGENNAYVVIVKFAGTQAGLVVDALLEQQELVVKSLDGLIGGGNGITGASILGDGRVVLILDVASLVNGVVLERRKEISGEEACAAGPSFR